MLNASVVRRIYEAADAGRWDLPEEALRSALERALASRFGGEPCPPRDAERFVESLHAGDLALACACARGDERAWEHFVREFRPVLYRVAGALAPGGDGREIADGLYADLFGLEERDGARRPLFHYYHGRSTLAGWLRAVVAQRVVDRAREWARTEPLPEREEAAGPTVAAGQPDPEPDRPRLVALLRAALAAALAALEPRQRLRLALYYTQGLTLAAIGRSLGESEATVSRKLDRARRDLRVAVERWLRDGGLSDEELALCFEYALGDWGFDLRQALPVPDASEGRT